MINDEQRNLLRGWLAERPQIFESIKQWPPDCKVTSREDYPLRVPAPGVTGSVVSWYESGTIGVIAPMKETITSPITDITVEAGEMVKGECDPSSLVFLEEGEVTRADIEELVAGCNEIEPNQSRANAAICDLSKNHGGWHEGFAHGPAAEERPGRHRWSVMERERSSSADDESKSEGLGPH